MPRYQTKAAYAAAMIRQAFADGKYAPGDRLQIGKLAKEIGLSLTPVREAFFELASEGLIDMHPHRGARVAEVSIADMTEVYLLREALESLATRLAAENGTDEEIEALAVCHDRLVAEVKAGKRDSLREVSDEFHDLVYDMARAPMVRRLIRQVWVIAPADTFKVIKDRPQHTVQGHARILDAIRTRDPEEAELRMREHVKDSFELIRAAKKRPVARKNGAKRSARPEGE